MIGVNFQVESNQTKLTRELNNAVEQGATNAPLALLRCYIEFFEPPRSSTVLNAEYRCDVDDSHNLAMQPCHKHEPSIGVSPVSGWMTPKAGREPTQECGVALRTFRVPDLAFKICPKVFINPIFAP